jgi:hypothetical protein
LEIAKAIKAIKAGATHAVDLASVAAFTTALKKEQDRRPAYKTCDAVVLDAVSGGAAPQPATGELARAAASKTLGGYGAAYDVNVATGMSATATTPPTTQA